MCGYFSSRLATTCPCPPPMSATEEAPDRSRSAATSRADCLLEVVMARLKTSADSGASSLRWTKNSLPYRSSTTLRPVRTASSSFGQASQVHGSVHHRVM